MRSNPPGRSAEKDEELVEVLYFARGDIFGHQHAKARKDYYLLLNGHIIASFLNRHKFHRYNIRIFYQMEYF